MSSLYHFGDAVMKRLDIDDQGDGFPILVEQADGRYVKYSDVEGLIDYLQDELFEAYNQLAEKHDDIREERDKLKLAVNRIHKHLEGIAEYQCSDDMWSIFLAIDEEVEDVLDA